MANICATAHKEGDPVTLNLLKKVQEGERESLKRKKLAEDLLNDIHTTPQSKKIAEEVIKKEKKSYLGVLQVEKEQHKKKEEKKKKKEEIAKKHSIFEFNDFPSSPAKKKETTKKLHVTMKKPRSKK